MKLYVYPTDRDWLSFLRGRPDLDEVNFWRPGGRLNFRALAPGELFLFRLKSPINRIAGGGMFLHSSLFPISASWIAFGEKNGAPNEHTFFERIAKYREVSPDVLDLESTIGCIILSAPFFLPEERWIDVPRELSLNRQQGQAMDATTGIGRALFEQVMASMPYALKPIDPTKPAAWHEPMPMFGDPVLTRRRLGQGSFKIVIADNYSRRCAVTGEKTFPVLDAAHILPVGKGGAHRPDNGLLLRTDLHKLFDAGYVTITPDCTFEVSPALREDYSNGKVYYDLAGRVIALPRAVEDRPGTAFLEYHRDVIYRGSAG